MQEVERILLAAFTAGLERALEVLHAQTSRPAQTVLGVSPRRTAKKVRTVTAADLGIPGARFRRRRHPGFLSSGRKRYVYVTPAMAQEIWKMWTTHPRIPQPRLRKMICERFFITHNTASMVIRGLHKFSPAAARRRAVPPGNRAKPAPKAMRPVKRIPVVSRTTYWSRRHVDPQRVQEIEHAYRQVLAHKGKVRGVDLVRIAAANGVSPNTVRRIGLHKETYATLGPAGPTGGSVDA
jgi:hypothetical protein